MRFETELIPARFLRRYQRFLADVVLPTGEIVVAHVPNTGSMLGAMRPGCPCRVSRTDRPGRKLRYTLEMLRPGRVWVGVHTGRANGLVGEAWDRGRVASWRAFDRAEAEIRVSAETRLDWVMWRSRPGLSTRKDLRRADLITCGPLHFIEVKNVSLAEEGTALFPDCVSARAARHMSVLEELVRRGHTAEIVYTIQRSDAARFAPADRLDPEYGRALRRAAAAGVLVSPFRCQVRRDGITLRPDQRLEVIL